jgi:hypothetical protein
MRFDSFESVDSRITQLSQELHDLQAQKATLDMIRFYCGTFFNRSEKPPLDRGVELGRITPKESRDTEE